MHTPKRQHAGFTLVELMVSISILALMLFLINEIFNSTSVAVTTSVQNAKNIAATRIVGEQWQDDASAMVGPDTNGEGGYIVIIQQRQRGVPMLDPRNLAEVPNPVDLRTDQIVFIRNAAGLRSITPQDAISFRNNLIGQDVGGFAKVWYGHVLRTQPDGRAPGFTPEFQLGGDSAGFDRIGSDWILGRQAMLFNPVDEVAVATGSRTDPTIRGNLAQYTYADNAYYGSLVQNSGYGGPRTAFMGLTDVTRQNYGPANDATGESMLFQLLDPSFTRDQQRDNYLRTAYRNPAQRLRVNPAPSPADTNYASWAIAQGHAILAPNCSEFIIDFAADFNGNGRVDMQQPGGGQDIDGAIVWYDALKMTGTFQWQRPSEPAFQPFVNLGADAKAFVFRVDDVKQFDSNDPAGGSSCWPYLIRIRYRLHDTRGRLTSNDPGALTDGIDNNGDGAVDEADEDQISGRWYEHIIKVPRPDPM
ncbi:MAG: type II secretion system protein J [Phycisphaeraceae bacterium]